VAAKAGTIRDALHARNRKRSRAEAPGQRTGAPSGRTRTESKPGGVALFEHWRRTVLQTRLRAMAEEARTPRKR